MSAWGWGLLGIIYLVLLFTLAIMTFRKGHWVLGLIGFIFPILWIIAALLPGGRPPGGAGAAPGPRFPAPAGLLPLLGPRPRGHGIRAGRLRARTPAAGTSADGPP